jgi:hypothetical protein
LCTYTKPSVCGDVRRTHRHPVNAVPSLCSLLKAVHKLYYQPSTHSDALLGRAICDMTADLLQKVPQDIAQSGLQSADVVYDNFVRDPVATIQGLYKQLGWDFSAEYEVILRDHLRKDQLERDALKARKGRAEVLHSYTPEEFHLTTEELTQSPRYADYIRNFNIPALKLSVPHH